VETSAARARPEAPAQGAAVAGRFAVQVGAFGESRAAEELAQTLRGKGFAAYVSPGATAAATRWRVRVGPFPSRPAAEKAAGRLAAEEKLPTWVLDENGPT
jgi:DedD protein